MFKVNNKDTRLALIQAIFYVGDRFWEQENRRPKTEKTNFFQDKFYSLKAHVHYFTVCTNLKKLKSCYTWYFYLFYVHKLAPMKPEHELTYRSPAAFYKSLITVVIALLRSTTAQKNFLYYLLPEGRHEVVLVSLLLTMDEASGSLWGLSAGKYLLSLE